MTAVIRRPRPRQLLPLLLLALAVVGLALVLTAGDDSVDLDRWRN